MGNHRNVRIEQPRHGAICFRRQRRIDEVILSCVWNLGAHLELDSGKRPSAF